MMNETNPNSQVDPQNSFGGCWPGDGSGMDDLADFNQMEGWDCE